MTEAEWLKCEDPKELFAHLAAKPTVRKLRLVLTGIARLAWRELPSERSQRAVVAAERYVDGEVSFDELDSAYRLAQASEESWSSGLLSARDFAAHAALKLDEYGEDGRMRVLVRQFLSWVNRGELDTDPASVSRMLRDIFGNPFRPVVFSPAWWTGTAVSFARTMYDSRDFGAMPILADALQDAGCDDEQVLAHCRDASAMHVRGCWVVDLVLGKE